MEERERKHNSKRTWWENLLSFLFFDDEPFELDWGQVSVDKGSLGVV